jgi:transposase
MDDWAADPEEPLHICLGRWATVHQRVGMDEGKVLALPCGEAGSRIIWHQILVAVLRRWGTAMNVRYRVELNQEERDQLDTILSGGKRAARKVKRAQILLAADAGQTDEAIAANVSVGLSTVYRTKRRFVLGNLEAALSEAPRPGADRKLSGKQQALLVATACSGPPAGRKRWTLELLADAIVRLTDHEDLSRETVRRCLAENDLKPWRRGSRRHLCGADGGCA